MYLLQKANEPADQGRDGSNERDGDDNGEVESEHGADEDDADQSGDEQSAVGAESDCAVDEVAAGPERAQFFLVRAGQVGAFGDEAVFDRAGAIDNAREPAGEHIEEGGDAREQENRCEGQADGARQVRSCTILHAGKVIEAAVVGN